jgi:hypothetical protein
MRGLRRQPFPTRRRGSAQVSGLLAVTWLWLGRREFTTAVRRAAKRRARNRCEVCGATEQLELHPDGGQTRR